MALEAELRSRVDRSLKELEEVVGSLHHVKRLADSQHASTAQLAQVTIAMEGVGAKFRELLESVGQSGATLQSAVEAVKTADPAAVVSRVNAVGESVAAVGQRVDVAAETGKQTRAELVAVLAGVEGTQAKIEAGARAQAAAIERSQKAVLGILEENGARVGALEKRVGMAIVAAWVAAGSAVVAAVMAAIGFLK